MTSRGRLASAVGVVATVVGGVATNRVQGPWGIQVMWFAAAIVFVGIAAWLVGRGSPSPVEQDDQTDPPPADPGDGSGGRSIRLTDTGSATGRDANSGLMGPANALTEHVIVERTGDAEAPDGGSANSGIRITGLGADERG